jgi:dipeptidase
VVKFHSPRKESRVKKQKKYLLLTSVLILLIFSGSFVFNNTDDKTETAVWQEDPEACTTILIGKDASADGSVIACQTADCGQCDFTWHYIPAADHPEGSVRKIYHIHQIRTWPPEVGGKWVKYVEGYTGIDIPEVPHTYAYQHAVFGHMNEHQLGIAESSIGCQRKMRNSTPSAIMDITTLTMLAMERCKTAREAIELMGSLAEKYGYGYHDSGEMLAVADPEEIWLFEIMPVGALWTPESGKPGAVWCAQRVPDDQVSFCPNESRIGEIDLDNKEYFMASSNAVSYAIENGFYDPESGEPFSWKKAYSPSPGSAAGTQGRRARLWRLFSLVAPSQNFDPATEGMGLPFSVKPDKKLSVQDVIEITRDKYKGTSFDPPEGLKGGPFANPNYFRGFQVDDQTYLGPRCVSVNNVEYTTITQSRSSLPDPIGGINWIAFGAQDTSCYIPLYCGMTEMPESFNKGDHFVFDRDSARWAFDYVDYHTQVAYSYAIEDVKKAQEKWESITFQKILVMDKAALELYKKDEGKAIEFITDFCVNNAKSVVDAWWELGDSLLVKYNHFRIYDPETRKVDRVETPEWWNRMVIERDKLVPLPQREPRPKVKREGNLSHREE